MNTCVTPVILNNLRDIWTLKFFEVCFSLWETSTADRETDINLPFLNAIIKHSSRNCKESVNLLSHLVQSSVHVTLQ